MTAYRSFLVLALLGYLCACGQAPSTNTVQNGSASTPAASSPLPAASIDLMAQGRKLYMDNCAGCHKEDGRGGKIEIEGKSIDPEDLTAEKIKALSDEKIYGYIHRGIEDEGMPAFKDKLSEAEIREVVRFVRSDIQKMPPASPAKPVASP